MQYLRIATSAAITSILLIVDAIASVAHAGAQGLGGAGFTGPGIGALISAALAFALADGAAHQWGSADGARRSRIFWAGLVGLVWGCIRVGMGDPVVVPALVGLAWCASSAWLFEEHRPAQPAP